MLTIATAFVLRWHFGQCYDFLLCPEIFYHRQTPAAPCFHAEPVCSTGGVQEGRGDYRFLEGDMVLEELMPQNFHSQNAELCNPAWISHTLSGVTQRIAAALPENMQLYRKNLVKYFRII